jgi:hypothetical protein
LGTGIFTHHGIVSAVKIVEFVRDTVSYIQSCHKYCYKDFVT